MKYVTDHFTLEMINERNYTIQEKNINKQKFMKSIKKAKSCILSNKIAKMLHKEKNNDNITLKYEDKIYIVTSEFGRNHSGMNKINNYRYTELTIIPL